MPAPSSGTVLSHPVTPDAILDGWRALLATGEHLHAPDFARLLGVSEASLVAARIGTGAVRLRPDPAELLSRLDECGRVLCAFSNRSGVLMPLGAVSSGPAEADILRLTGEHMSAELGCRAVAEVFLFEESDAQHGNTRSLQFFEKSGAPVVKIFIFHKTKFEAASKHFLDLTHTDQDRSPRPEETAPTFDPLAASLREDADTATLMDPDPQTAIKRFCADCGDKRLAIEATGRHARVTWVGHAPKPAFRGGMVHFHGQDVRAHLRLAPLAQANQTASCGIAFNENTQASSGGKPARLLRFAMQTLGDTTQ